MMSLAFLAFLVALVLAAPVVQKEKRQSTDNEFTDGGCRDIILFFVRGTFEAGNMVSHHPGIEYASHPEVTRKIGRYSRATTGCRTEVELRRRSSCGSGRGLCGRPAHQPPSGRSGSCRCFEHGIVVERSSNGLPNFSHRCKRIFPRCSYYARGSVQRFCRCTE